MRGLDDCDFVCKMCRLCILQKSEITSVVGGWVQASLEKKYKMENHPKIVVYLY